jgi:hypothetical protein
MLSSMTSAEQEASEFLARTIHQCAVGLGGKTKLANMAGVEKDTVRDIAHFKAKSHCRAELERVVAALTGPLPPEVLEQLHISINTIHPEVSPS